VSFRGRGRRIVDGCVWEVAEVRENNIEAASGSVPILNSGKLDDGTHKLRVTSGGSHIARKNQRPPHYDYLTN